MKKPNIGIMSMQRIFNYGSWMQAYALKNILEELGASVQFVDYHIGKPEIHSCKEFIGYYLRFFKHLFEELITDSRVLTKITHNKWFLNEYNFKHNDLRELLGGSLKRNYNPTLDCLVVGSDEVFNCLQISPRVGFSVELLGQYPYATKKISYAASFGNTTLEKIIAKDKKDIISHCLDCFDSISVRDENSYEIVFNLLNKRPFVNLDPVLVWDFSSYLNTLNNPRDTKYMIVYTYPKRLSAEECSLIEKFARKRGLRILGINANYSFLDEMIYDSPLKILQYFAFAECVIADTFHGTLFSIINHKPFASIIRTSENGKYGNSEKLVDVLRRLNLTDRIIENINNIDSVFDVPIDYSSVDQVIATERINAYEYLKRSIFS